MLNKYGERTQPCRTPFLTRNHSDSVPVTLTLASCFLLAYSLASLSVYAMFCVNRQFGTAVINETLPHRYGTLSHAIWDHTVLPAIRQRWHYPQPLLVLDSATPEGCKAELAYMHCSKGAQPVPKTVYHSGIRDKPSRRTRRMTVCAGRSPAAVCSAARPHPAQPISSRL